jgi:hypothetical protein
MTTVVKIDKSDLFVVSIQSLVKLHTEQVSFAVMPLIFIEEYSLRQVFRDLS